MGVMECDRDGCENIMCTRYSSTYGYICYECLEELEKVLPEFNFDIGKFMQSSRKVRPDFTQTIREMVDKEFRLC